MRICFVIGTLRFSGAEKVLAAVATHLSELGHDVHVVLTLSPEIPAQDSPFSVHQVEAHGVRPLRILRRATGLRRTIATVAPDVSISFGYANNVNCIPALLANGVPHIVCERNNPIYDPPGWGPALLRRLLYPLAAAAVFQTETIRGLFSQLVRRKSAVIPNPVIDAAVALAPRVSASLPFRIISVGRLSDRDKNQSLLIMAFAALASDFPEWVLELYGEGPDRGVFEALISELELANRVLLCGHVDDPGSALRTADVFALPSRTEGMPNALIEAMAAGVACVATDCSGGGAAALITHNVNGLICANDDLGALVTSLRRVMLDRDLRRRLGGAAVGIRQTHSLERTGQKWLEVIRAQLA